ncbi:MAG: hypothetical protein JSS49_17350 [Planctomycetes bacterium]|nr:hypothetical protein [Planctomycetota bacterium]
MQTLLKPTTSSRLEARSSGPQSRVKRPRRLSLLKRCLFSVIPLVTLLVSAEIGARLLTPTSAGPDRFQQIEQIIVYLGNEPGQSIFEPDPNCFWRLKPNVVLPEDRSAAWGGRMSNSHGLRSREVTLAAAQQRRRVLCFGDSSTFAFGVGFDDAWPNQLQEQLDEEQPGAIEVLNAGVPGQSSYQGRHRLIRELDKWSPEVAFITFGNNDGWRWDGRADKDHASSLRTPQGLSVLNHSRAWQWLIEFRHRTARNTSIQNQLDWAQQATWNYFQPNADWTPRVSVDDFGANLMAMVDQCRQHHCQPVLIVWPDQRQLLGQSTWRPPYQIRMREVARTEQVECLDLVPLFEQEGDWAVERFIPNDVVHLDRAGNRFVAEEVAKRLRDCR